MGLQTARRELSRSTGVGLACAVVGALTLGTPAVLDADGTVQGLALVERARTMHTLQAPIGSVVHLKVHIWLRGLVVGDREGEFQMVRESADTWFSTMRFPGFNETVGMVGGERWRKRNTVDKPFRMHQASRALDLHSHLRLAPSARVVKSWNETVGGRAVDCISVSPVPDYYQRERAGQAALPSVGLDEESKVSLCFDSSTGALAVADYGNPMPRYEWSGSMSLGSAVYPTKATCLEGKDVAVEADVTELAAMAPGTTDNAFAMPAGADRWKACSNSTPPKLVQKKLVKQSSFTKARRIFGTVICFAEVGADGTIHDLAPVQVRQGDLFMQVKDAAESLVYQPATCDGTPVPFELYLAYRFMP